MLTAGICFHRGNARRRGPLRLVFKEHNIVHRLQWLLVDLRGCRNGDVGAIWCTAHIAEASCLVHTLAQCPVLRRHVHPSCPPFFPWVMWQKEPSKPGPEAERPCPWSTFYSGSGVFPHWLCARRQDTPTMPNSRTVPHGIGGGDRGQPPSWFAVSAHVFRSPGIFVASQPMPMGQLVPRASTPTGALGTFQVRIPILRIENPRTPGALGRWSAIYCRQKKIPPGGFW